MRSIYMSDKKSLILQSTAFKIWIFDRNSRELAKILLFYLIVVTSSLPFSLIQCFVIMSSFASCQIQITSDHKIGQFWLDKLLFIDIASFLGGQALASISNVRKGYNCLCGATHKSQPTLSYNNKIFYSISFKRDKKISHHF